MENERINWKPLVILLAFVFISMVPPIALDMAYNSDYYFSEIGMLNASLTDCGCELPSQAPVGKVEIGTITYQELPDRANKQSEVVKEQIKSLPKQDKKLVCQDPRPLIQGSGIVRVCEWK